MYTIGQISAMFNLPVSTLRYYDNEGLFPGMKRTSGIRQFSDIEIEALHVIECLIMSRHQSDPEAGLSDSPNTLFSA